MGRMNEMLGAAANYSRGIAVQFGLEEQEGAPTVAPEIIPTSDIHMRPEQWALHGGTLLWGQPNAAAVAGVQSHCSIEPGVGELVIVDGVLLVPDTVAKDVNFTIASSPLADSTGNLVARDARRIVSAGGSGASGTRMRQQNLVAPPAPASTITRITLISNGPPVWVPMDLVLVAPWSLRLHNQSVNVALERHLFFVRVRPGTPRELSIGNL
jgi:hypothetical protein